MLKGLSNETKHFQIALRQQYKENGKTIGIQLILLDALWASRQEIIYYKTVVQCPDFSAYFYSSECGDVVTQCGLR